MPYALFVPEQNMGGESIIVIDLDGKTLAEARAEAIEFCVSWLVDRGSDVSIEEETWEIVEYKKLDAFIPAEDQDCKERQAKIDAEDEARAAERLEAIERQQLAALKAKYEQGTQS